MSRKYESNVFGMRQGEMSPTANSSLESGKKKIFHELHDTHHVKKVGIKTFLGLEGRNESKSIISLESGEHENFPRGLHVQSCLEQ